MDKIKIVDYWKTRLTNCANYLLHFLNLNCISFSGLKNISATKLHVNQVRICTPLTSCL